jgi:hypothetical protein
MTRAIMAAPRDARTSGAKTAIAPFVGKRSHSNVQRGVLLCGVDGVEGFPSKRVFAAGLPIP